MKSLSANAASSTEVPHNSRLMVDAPTRVFHWLLALCFVGAYVTSESERWRLVHITLGYTALGLLGFRLLWAVLGPRPVRWQTWRSRVQAAKSQLSDWRWSGAKWSGKLVALNTLVLLALVMSVMLAVASGIGVDQEWWGEALEEVHEFFGNGLLLIVLTHVGLIALSAWLKAGMPWQAMVTGRVSGRGADLVSAPRRWLAVLMLAAVAAFWYWQWQSAPTAPLGSEGGAFVQGDEAGHHDDDAQDRDDDDD